MKAEAKKCAVCGKKFTPKVVNSKCCSDKCRKEAKRQRDAARKPAEKKTAKPDKRVVGKAVEKIELPKKHETKKPVTNGKVIILPEDGCKNSCNCKKAKSPKSKK